MNEINMQEASKLPQDELIFALDIGTRSVIGVVGQKNGDSLKVLAVESVEHTKRAMIDGQIEDIEQVARIAEAVKNKLEERLCVSLTNVCVAAAGRSLKTERAFCECDIDEKQLIKRSQAVELELAAVDVAYEELSKKENGATSFSCVGYSVLKYYLDDYPISSLIDHRGKHIKIEVVATFLPNGVIESLYEVTSRIGLAVSSLTLEPIAAMNAIIPQELRMLNLALVDIGAGTSDIAISNDGSVTAYTMVTLAGDEISESIVQTYLVDFHTAENIKQQLSMEVGSVKFQDIIGFDYELSCDEIFESIKDCTSNLCGAIADQILAINGQKPSAVFLVGGGSRLVNMAAIMAQKLDIPLNKVAIGGSNFMKKMIEADIDVTVAEYATPMGIAITAMNMMEKTSITVSLNGKPVNLFKNSNITVIDVLLMSGYKQAQLIGRSGQSVTFEINMKKYVARGEHPTPAQILINGKPASLTTTVVNGDELSIMAATSGEDAHPKISEYVEGYVQFPVFLNGSEKIVGTLINLNDVQVYSDEEIHNFDTIQTLDVFTIKQLSKAWGIDYENCIFTVNGQKQPVDYVMSTDDDIRFELKIDSVIEQADEDISPEQMLNVTVNGNKISLPPKPDATAYLFFDMLNFIEIDPSKPHGNIVLLLNGVNAQYLDILKEGDEIQILWENEIE